MLREKEKERKRYLFYLSHVYKSLSLKKRPSEKARVKTAGKKPTESSALTIEGYWRETDPVP